MPNPLFSPNDFAEFDNVRISIVREGGSSGKNAFGASIAASPTVILPEQGAQEWELTASDKEGLTGEQIALRKKIRLNAYHPEITPKHVAIVDGAPHNILVAGHDGSKSVSILTLERITPHVS